MPVNGIELKEGQKWKTLSGRVATLEDNPGAGLYIFRTVYEDGKWDTITKDGNLWASDYYSFLRELIYDPEQQVKEKLTMKFNPKPGDKIICNNGEEFICCTLEFLQETIAKFIRSNKPILGYWKYKHNNTWQDWDEHGKASYNNDEDYNIREVIPQSSETLAFDKRSDIRLTADTVISLSRDTEEEVKEEPRYTVEEVIEAIQLVTPNEAPWNWVPEIKEHLNKAKDPQYLEYLRLKAIYG